MIAAMPVNFSDERGLREKARLNASIARDLAESFGGDIADYLKRLNKNLRKRTSTGMAGRPCSDKSPPVFHSSVKDPQP